MVAEPPDTAAPPGPLARSAEAAGAAFLGIAETTGAMAVLFGRIVARLVAFPPQVDGPELKRNLYKMAVKSLPIVVITALFTGVIVVIQAAPIVKRYGAEAMLGWGAGFGTLREVAPLLTALMISKRLPDAAVPMSLLADHPNVCFSYLRPGLGEVAVKMR